MRLSDARRRETYALLQRHGSASIGEIAALLHVSSQTVRRDLDQLGREGLVLRVRGGATVAGAGTGRPRSPDEEVQRRVAARAAPLVQPGSTIFLSGSATATHLVPWLASVAGLTVVTNALDVADALCAAPGVQAIVLGGTLRHDRRTLLGDQAERGVRELAIDHAVLVPHGVDADAALYAPSVAEAALLRAVVETATGTTLLAPSWAFARRGPFRLQDAGRIGTIVVERDLPPGTHQALAGPGREVLVA